VLHGDEKGSAADAGMAYQLLIDMLFPLYPLLQVLPDDRLWPRRSVGAQLVGTLADEQAF
jgi:hypothetical protein